MIGDYLVVALVFGIAVSYVAIIHHFWLRDAFKPEAPLNVPAKREGTGQISIPRHFPRLKSRALPQTQVAGRLILAKVLQSEMRTPTRTSIRNVMALLPKIKRHQKGKQINESRDL